MNLLLIEFGTPLPEEIKQALHDDGHHLVVGQSFDDLFTRLEDHPFDAVILEHRASSWDPRALIKRLPDGHPPLIGWAPGDVAEELLEAGFDDIIDLHAPTALWKLRIAQSTRKIERRRAEVARQESEQLLTEITDQIPGIVYRFVLDAQGHYRMPFVSSRIRNFFDISPEEAEEMTPLFAQIHPEDIPELYSSIAASAATMTPWDYEFRFFVHGNYRWFHGHSLPRHGQNGSIVWHGIFRDITHQKRLEERLRIADRLASLGTLSAGITHEINNPLSFILSNLRGLFEELPELNAEDAEVALRSAISGAERIEKIISGLQSFAYLKKTPLEPLRLGTTLEDTLQIVGTELQRHATLTLDLAANPIILGRRNDLVQIFLNLLINARQAMPSARPDQNRILIRLSLTDAPRARAEVLIDDNGEGISKENLPKIFDPFFTTKEVGQGTGLGLYICHTLISAMDGEIEVTSTPGAGSRFRVLLPLFEGQLPNDRADADESK